MTAAETIAIGTEILLGEIVDTNTRHIAQRLRALGVDLYWTSTVGDNEARIAEAVGHALARSDIVITTGGLGPTVDDATRQGIARAFGRGVEFRPELWEQIQDRYRRFGREPTENNKRQAFVPQGAVAISNPIGTAPAFLVEAGERTVIALPGVPKEMEFLLETEVLPYLADRYKLHGVIAVRLLHTAGVGESQIDERLDDLEQLANPTVGLAAHTGQVDVRITAKADSPDEARKMIREVEEEIQRRLGDWIYGADAETLERVALRHLASKGWRLVVIEAGLNAALLQKLAGTGEPFLAGELRPTPAGPEALQSLTAAYRRRYRAQVGLGIALQPGTEQQDLYFSLITPQGERQLHRTYGGPPGNAPRWAANIGLDLIRRL